MEIRPACGDYSGTSLFCLPGPDLWHWIGAHENYRVFPHICNPFLFDYPWTRCREGNDHIRSSHSLRNPAFLFLFIGNLAEPVPGIVFFKILPVRMKNPVKVSHDHFTRIDPCSQEES